MTTTQKRKMASMMLTREERLRKVPIFQSKAWFERQEARAERIKKNIYKINIKKKMREYEEKKRGY